jgi:Domain of unknown function (DUF5666)
MSEPAELDPFGAEWDRPRWTNRLTWVLVAAVVAALAFAGGLLIERQYDTTLLTTARGATRGAGGGLAVAGLGGGRGAGGRPANPSGSGACGSGGPAAAGAGSASVGTVASVNADRLTLTNFAGKTVTVTVPPNATVTTSGLAGLKPGAPVSVIGTANPDGSVTATSITSRTAGG